MAFSYGKKLSRLPGKLFDKFTSENSPSYENGMKSCLTFIWDEKFSCVMRSRLLIGEISIYWKIFALIWTQLIQYFPAGNRPIRTEQNYLASRNVSSLTESTEITVLVWTCPQPNVKLMLIKQEIEVSRDLRFRKGSVPLWYKNISNILQWLYYIISPETNIGRFSKFQCWKEFGNWLYSLYIFTYNFYQILYFTLLQVYSFLFPSLSHKYCLPMLSGDIELRFAFLFNCIHKFENVFVLYVPPTEECLK
mgnify:CR=1 FL=1